MSIVNMYAAGTATADAAAMVDIPKEGRIVGISWSTYSDGIHNWSLEFGPTKQETTTDARSVVATFQGNNGAIAGYIPVDLKIMQGERLYLHRREMAAGTAANVRIILQLHIDDKADVVRVRR